MATEWALEKAAAHLVGPDLPSEPIAGKAHERLAILLDSVRDDLTEEIRVLKLRLTETQAERDEPFILRSLATPDSEWFGINFGKPCISVPAGGENGDYCGHYQWWQRDPRLQERLASLQPEHERRLAEWRERRAKP